MFVKLWKMHYLYKEGIKKVERKKFVAMMLTKELLKQLLELKYLLELVELKWGPTVDV